MLRINVGYAFKEESVRYITAYSVTIFSLVSKLPITQYNS